MDKRDDVGNLGFDIEDMNSTAQAYYDVMIANGRTPSEVSGGPLDGALHFEIELDGTAYWITKYGILDPAELE
jgi:hypothetical protein